MIKKVYIQIKHDKNVQSQRSTINGASVSYEDNESETEVNIISRHIKKNALVVTRNDFVNASYSNEPNQEKLMYAAMVVVRKLELENNEQFNPDSLIAISAKNFAEVTHELSHKNEELTAAEQLQIERTADKALNRIYSRFEPLMMKIRVEGSSLPAKVPMITYCHYDPTNKVIYIRFAPEFYKYFYRIVVREGKSEEKIIGYNTHELKQITTMDSFYAIRIYRMLIESKWKSSILEVTIDQLKWVLDCADKYKTIDNFKRRVIEPALNEINEKTNLEVEYENIKQGKSVIGIKFRFKYKAKYRQNIIEEKLQTLKTKILKRGEPYSEDGSHFKSPDRAMYIKQIDSFSSKQIGFLISCEQFLRDYGDFYAGSMTDDTVASRKMAKEILGSLLKNRPEILNNFKMIDFEYYVYCQCIAGLLNLKKDQFVADDETIKAIENFDIAKD